MSKVILRTIVIDRQIYIRNRRKCGHITFVMFILSCITYLRFTFGENFSFDKWNWNDDISCYLQKDDNLTSITDINPSVRSIFFSDSRCNTHFWDPKDACVVESAARAHLTWPVYILFNSPVSKDEIKKNDALRVLSNIPNIRFARVNIEEYSIGTPAEGLVSSGALNYTTCPIKLTEGLVKYITLYKWGGIFMEKDVIVTKSLSSLSRNWVPKQSEDSIGSGILALSKDARSIAESALRLLVKNQKNIDCKNGENIMSKIVEQECTSADPETKAAVTCNGFDIYGPQFFYPIESENVGEYFKSGELPGYEMAYTYYLWTRLTLGAGFMQQDGSRYTKLARKYCPSIYAAYRYKF